MKNFQIKNLANHIENGELFLTENLAGTRVGIADTENTHYKFGKYKDKKLVQLTTHWIDDEDQFEYVAIDKVLDLEKVWHMENKTV